MDNVKNDAYYIKRLKQDLEFVVTHMKNVDIEELNANEVLFPWWSSVLLSDLAKESLQ